MRGGGTEHDWGGGGGCVRTGVEEPARNGSQYRRQRNYGFLSASNSPKLMLRFTEHEMHFRSQ